MTRSMRGQVGALLAMLVLAFTASSSSASRGIQLGAGGSQTIGVGGNVTINSGLATCDLLMTIQSDGIILKRSGSQGERFTAATISNCRGGMVTAARALLPFDLEYSSFSGTLPIPTDLNMVSNAAAIAVTTPVGVCLYLGRRIPKWLWWITLPLIRFVDSRLARVSGSALCPAQLVITGNLAVLGRAPAMSLV